MSGEAFGEFGRTFAALTRFVKADKSMNAARSEVTFSLAGTDYAVFDYTENGQRSAGVHVTTADGTVHDVRCAGSIQGQLLPFGKSLRCDSDNALNGGQCP